MSRAVLHLKQDAWLAATPEGFSRPRREWIAMHKGRKRAEAFEVPPGPLRWLVDLLAEAGGVSRLATMNGVIHTALTWQDIAAWVQGAGREDVGPFWRGEIIKLSGHLAGAMNRSSEAESPAPYEPD